MQEWSLSYRLGKGLRRLFRDKSGIMAFVGLAILLTYLIMAVFAPYLSPYDPVKRSGRAFSAPSKEHWFGTTNLGYDVLSRIIYGARIALKIAFLAVVVAAAIGIPLGLISGYVGGAFDRILSMFMDAIYSFPGLILAIAIAAVLGPGVINVALSIAVIYAPTYFRVIRNQVTSLKDQLFVEAARAMGARNFTILGRYILPNVLPSVIVVLSMNLADAIMTEAGLSFLGLGISPPTPDWGYDLSNGQRFLLLNYWWMILFPGFAIITIVLGFSLFSEGLNEFLNPNVGETRR
ncbi:peptide ABC transporter permease [Kosmotoga arenicorallina S304]|uniref:Peptide ABC transporter permease n=1 Tax=Kosmotoga arenicorallina S304 TaxID=1453497 RepID=A0A182C8G1_9BACT|nr:ABC transporter permease [Kosmotoga arenicorallina]OAA31796.1 peptide ABC transporter permease [Kosmotoga arenicorallina S304]